MQTRPIPPDLTVADLDHRERLCIQCPSCRQQIGRQCFDLSLELPADYLVARYVERHCCRACSRPGKKVRAWGWIEDFPRSGAEGYRQKPSQSNAGDFIDF
jgi:hypothetical protein